MLQTILVGLGGTGSRVVNNVVKELKLRNESINNGQICCAILDTNVMDNRLIRNSGTGVPVFGTGKAQSINTYMTDYTHLRMDAWCPWSPSFGEQTIIDGASEMRVKSRIAFTDFMESGEIGRLEALINDVLKNNSGSKIRVMIVSSLSGGSGSGMFIQVALWLRRLLGQSAISITGTFLLPDIFVRTVKDIRENRSKVVRHYSNAYAAIRDLNSLSQIAKNDALDVSERIVLGDLFDSDRDKGCGRPVYDWAFFVDDQDENGNYLLTMQEYERMVAQLVYMQLYAPMAESELYSVLDNAFLKFEEADEPLYGSCGTAKAQYPMDSVLKYCTIRAAQDSLTNGWCKIDDEIRAQIIDRRQAERDGTYLPEFDPRARYVRLYEEKTSTPPEKMGRDRFFYFISKDAKNETRTRSGEEIITKYSDKVTDFTKALVNEHIMPVVHKHGGVSDFAIDEDTFVAEDHTVDQLVEQAKNYEKGFADALEKFDSRVDTYAEDILNAVFPLSMDDVQMNNVCSIYGMLSKADTKGKRSFVHPVSVRYMLYRVVAELEKGLKKIVLKDSRAIALSGGEASSLFDNKKTKEKEDDALKFLESRRWYQPLDAFLDDFESRFAQFTNSKIALAENYEKEKLQFIVYGKLIERINGMIEQLEAFFERMGEVSEKLGMQLAENVEETKDIVGKTVFVLGKKEDKERIYESLDVGLDGNADPNASNSAVVSKCKAVINQSVIQSVYGSYCARVRPSNTANLPYAGLNLVDAFVSDIQAIFADRITGDRNNYDKINLNIYQALCQECDAEVVANGGNILVRNDVEAAAASRRHEDYFAQMTAKLERMAAPFLIHDQERSTTQSGAVTMSKLRFWGFHPDVVAAFPNINYVLQSNSDLEANVAYSPAELCCFRATCGIGVSLIPKFREKAGGKYFPYYEEIVNGMLERADLIKHPEFALVSTPHLDKTWHRILPHITKEKRDEERLAFYRGFWLAIAYGVIGVDKDGYFYINREDKEKTEITCKGRRLSKTDIALLLEALRTDRVFVGSDVLKLEEKFAKELVDMDTYVGTKLMKGLAGGREETNPVQIIIRYNEGPQHSHKVTTALIDALESFAVEMVKKYDEQRDEKQMEVATYRICRKIYDSCKRTQGKSKVFGKWEKKFDDYKIKGDGDSAQ